MNVLESLPLHPQRLWDKDSSSSFLESLQSPHFLRYDSDKNGETPLQLLLKEVKESNEKWLITKITIELVIALESNATLLKDLVQELKSKHDMQQLVTSGTQAELCYQLALHYIQDARNISYSYRTATSQYLASAEQLLFCSQSADISNEHYTISMNRYSSDTMPPPVLTITPT
jgi:hypothetical protein